MRVRNRSTSKSSFLPRVEWLEVRECLSTFFVATNGSNSGNGSAANPWATLQYAADQAEAGDIVIVRAGTYKGWVQETSGAVNNPITFKADPGVIINQAGNLSTPAFVADRGDGINIEMASWIVVDGFTIQGQTYGTNIGRAGIRSVENDHVWIVNNRVDGAGRWGVLTGFTDYVTIENNTMINSVKEHGIYVSNSTLNPTIRNNVIYGNYANGIHMNGDQDSEPYSKDVLPANFGLIQNALVEGNTIYENGRGGGSGINGDGLVNSTIRNNLLYNNHASGISLYRIDGRLGSTGNTIVNNTVIVASDGRWALNIRDGATGNTVFNNIFYNNHSFRGGMSVSADSLSGFRSDYNVVMDRFTTNDGSSVQTLAQWRSSTGQDANSVVSTPAALFVNAAGGDYHLKAGAVAINLGVATFNGKTAPATDRDGLGRVSAYDAGAFEFQTGAGNAPPTVATPAAATAANGTTTNLSVLGADDAGEAALTYTWALTTKPSGAADPTFSANGTNAAKNSTATFSRAGSYTFQVTIRDAAGLTATSSVTVVVNQTLTTIALTPASVTLNSSTTQQFSAQGRDQFGQALSSQPTFTWTLASGVGSVSSTGLYTAPATAGSAVVRAASGAVSATANVTVNVVNAAPTVATPAAATVANGTTTNLSVLGADDAGEANLTYTWAITNKPSGAADPTFSTNGTNAAKNSTATFNRAGAYTFQVTIRDAAGLTTTSNVTVTVNQTLTSIALTPASVTLGGNGTQQFSAQGRDQFGQALTTQPTFAWSIASGVGSVSSSGLYTAPATSGSAVVRAASGAVSATANVTVDVVNAAPTVATPAAGSAANGTTTSLSVLGADDAGEAALTYTWALTNKPSGAADPTFSANGTNAAKNSTATFSRAGSYSFQVTIRDAAGLTATSSVTVVVNQTLTAIALTPAAVTLSGGATQQFSAQGRDQFGQALTTQPAFAWSLASGVGSVSSSGLYTAPAAAGSAVVQATSGAVSATANVTVNVVGNAAPTVAVPPAASATIGKTVNLSVLGADDGGEAALTYTWGMTTKPYGAFNPTYSVNGTNAAKNTTATFTMAGDYGFQVTIRDAAGRSVTADFTVTVTQTLTTINVTPGTASLSQNATQQFSAQGRDQFGNAMTAAPAFAWTIASGVGSVSSTGLYTANGGPGSAVVRAASGAVSATATVTVSNRTPTVATPASATPGAVTGKTTNLSVLGADDGGAAALTYTWAVTSKPSSAATPIFSANGTNAARNSTATFSQAGSYTFRVTIRDAGGLTVTSSVTVTVRQTLTTVALTPASVTLNTGATQQFTAQGRDQFGRALTTQPTFAWSIASGVGSISTTGRYTAPASAGSAVVRATSGGVSGTAVVTVNAPAQNLYTRINFTASAAETPAGWLSDGGAVFGSRGNGFSYGWNLNNSSTARDRDASNSPSEMHDSFLHMQKSANPNAVWEIAVPNGTYSVRIIAGDALHTDSIFRIAAEGVLAVNGSPSSANRWVEGTATVTVTDGRLTISNGSGAQNNKINAIEIYKVA